MDPMTYDDKGFQKLVWNFLGVFFLVFQIHFQMFGSLLTDNLLYALNAFRCLIFNIPFMQWNTVGVWYYILSFFGLKETIEFYVDGIYLAVCTCSTEAQQFSKFFGATDRSIQILTTCRSSNY